MGRLFWKFFLFAMFAQFAVVVGIGTWIWLRNEGHSPRPPERGPAQERRLDEAVESFQRGGVSELRGRLEAWRREPGPQVLAIDESGRELLGRRIDRMPDAPADGPADSPPPPVRQVTSGGSTLVLFLEPGHRPADHRPMDPLRRAEDHGPRFPTEPVVGALVAAVVIALLLAMYVAKPIHALRRAFDAVADGRLDVRIGDAMGRRRDELADLGRDFDRTVDRLQSLVDGQQRLLHTVSHELRSPLARLQAAVGLARQSASVEQSMDRIELEATRMDRLVDELLTLSRVQSRVAVDKSEPIDVPELIADVAADAAYEVEAAGRPVRVEIDVAPIAGVAVRGNPEMLHRALDNVLRNAIRHAAEPGHVRVAARRDAATREVVITIDDNGTGVPESELKSIFEPFYRGERARVGQGHGLGLAIARGVVDVHGGSVSASNSPGSGLAVEIRLPVAP